MWRMVINEKKTKIMHFRKKSTRRTNFPFICCGKSIETTESYKYLGLWFSEFCDMTLAAKEIAKSATRALGLLISKYKALGGLSYQCFNKLYESNVESILRYGAGVYGYKEYKILGSVQNRAARFVLGMNKTCSNIASRGDLGWTSWLYKQKLEVIRLWLRLSNIEPTRMLNKIFKYNCMKAITCKLKNWEYNIIDMFHSIDMPDLVNIGLCDTRIIIKNCKEKLFKLDANLWYEMLWNDKDLENGNKLRTYRTFKFELCTEKYVLLNIPLYKKNVFSM